MGESLGDDGEAKNVPVWLGGQAGLALVEEFEEALAAHASSGHVRADMRERHLVRGALDDERPQNARCGHAEVVAFAVGNMEPVKFEDANALTVVERGERAGLTHASRTPRGVQSLEC